LEAFGSRPSEDFHRYRRASTLCPSLDLVFLVARSLRFVSVVRLRSSSSSVAVTDLLLLASLGVHPWRCMNLFVGSRVHSARWPLVSPATDSALVLIFFSVGLVILHYLLRCSIIASTLIGHVPRFVAS
jgi:hypothetical protein